MKSIKRTVHKAFIISGLLLFVIYLFAFTQKKNDTTSIFNNDICSCDSIWVDELTQVYMDSDSNLFSVQTKEPFDYHLKIDSNYVLVNGREYHYLLEGGGIIDTVGYLSINDSSYIYRYKPNGKDAVLFNFNAKTGKEWTPKNGGRFDVYNVRLENKYYSSKVKDTIYVFKFDFNDIKLGFEEYFDEIKLTRNDGILMISFTNGVHCYTKNGLKIK